MNQQPVVSVIVATYMREAELTRALESLATQTYTDFEIVVVDDNANPEWNDRVEAVIQSFRAGHPHIALNYIRNAANQGSAQTRNIGIEVARGEYVCFLDDDDLYLPDRIQNQICPMQEAGADYGLTDLTLYGDDETYIETRTRTYIKATDPQSLLGYHLKYHMTGTDTMMCRRDYLQSIGGFPPIDVGDEFYLMQKAIEMGGKFLYVPTCDAKAYVHTGEGGLSSGQGKIDGENRLFEHKKQYFKSMDRKTVSYIKMRHHAVLAFAYLRMKRYVAVIPETFKSFFAAPIDFFKLWHG